MENKMNIELDGNDATLLVNVINDTLNRSDIDDECRESLENVIEKLNNGLNSMIMIVG